MPLGTVASVEQSCLRGARVTLANQETCTGVMGEGAGRPAVAYVALAADVLDPAAELARWREWLEVEARARGFDLVQVYADVWQASDGAFYALCGSLTGSGAAMTVLVPEVQHLQHVGPLLGADLAAASRHLRARVVALGPGADVERTALPVDEGVVAVPARRARRAEAAPV